MTEFTTERALGPPNQRIVDDYQFTFDDFGLFDTDNESDGDSRLTCNLNFWKTVCGEDADE